MTDDYAVEGEEGGYVPCFELPAVLVVEEEGAISGQAGGRVPRDNAPSSLPAPEREAIVGSAVGYVAAPCEEECLPAGPAQGVFKAYRRFTPVTTTILSNPGDQDMFPPRPAAVETTGGTIAAYGLQADGRGREGTIQFTVPGSMSGLHITIVVRIGLSAITNAVGHPRCYTNIPFDWELRRAGWGASFSPTFDDFQLDAVGSVLASGTFAPPETICYPAGGGDPQIVFPILTYEDDFTKDVNGKIQFQLRISNINADAAYAFNNNFYGSGSYNPVDDEWLHSHSRIYTSVTVCALS